MKHILKLIMLMLVVSNTLFAGKWERVDLYREWVNGPNDYFSILLEDISCADENNCISGGSLQWTGTTILRATTDGGLTWFNILRDTVPPKRKIIKIEYPDTNLVVVLCDSGYILKSTNKGSTWSESMLHRRIYNISFENDRNGLSFYLDKNDTSNYIMYTLDGGINWTEKKIIFTDSLSYKVTDGFWPGLTNLLLINKENFIGLLYNPYQKIKNGIPRFLIKSTDMGDSWQVKSSFNHFFDAMYFINENVGWIGGVGDYDSLRKANKDRIEKTTDGGLTWTVQLDSVASKNFISSIKCSDSLNCIANTAGISYCYWRTSDGGNKWVLDSTNKIEQNYIESEFDAIAMPSSDRIFAIYKEGGRIYRYSNHTDVAFDDKDELKLTIYPNIISSNGSFEADIVLKKSSYVEFQIYSTTGVLMDKSGRYFIEPGNNRVRYDDTIGLSSGYYWLKVNIDGSCYRVKPFIVQ